MFVYIDVYITYIMAAYIKREYYKDGKIKCEYFSCDGKIEGDFLLTSKQCNHANSKDSQT